MCNIGAQINRDIDNLSNKTKSVLFIQDQLKKPSETKALIITYKYFE